MTRDQWLNRCAERLRDKAGMEPGEAAAYAINMSETQVADNGRNPADWDKPNDAADEEISYMSEDEDGADASGSDV